MEDVGILLLAAVSEIEEDYAAVGAHLTKLLVVVNTFLRNVYEIEMKVCMLMSIVQTLHATSGKMKNSK